MGQAASRNGESAVHKSHYHLELFIDFLGAQELKVNSRAQYNYNTKESISQVGPSLPM